MNFAGCDDGGMYFGGLGSLQIGGRANDEVFKENSVYLGGRAADGGWWIAEDGRRGQS